MKNKKPGSVVINNKEPKYGHTGIVTVSKILNSPCHKAKPIEMVGAADETGFNPVKYACSVCKKEYNAIELTII